MSESNTVALVSYRVGALFHVVVGFRRRTRAVDDARLGVGGKVKAAGFPDPRGGHGFRRGSGAARRSRTGEDVTCGKVF